MTAAAGIIGFIGGFSTCLVAVACCRDRSITNIISAGAFEHNGKLFSVREVRA